MQRKQENSEETNKNDSEGKMRQQNKARKERLNRRRQNDRARHAEEKPGCLVKRLKAGLHLGKLSSGQKRTQMFPLC